MRAGLADCGVESEALHVNDMDLDPERRFRDARARFKPDAMLVVREAGGQVVIGRYGTSSDLIVDMQLFDSKTDKSFWHARSELSLLTRNLYADDGASGERFARDTVERLRTDGLLKNCKPPAPAAEPPSSGPTIRGGQWSPGEAGPYKPPGT